jgi:splicing factor 3B subunit 3
MMLTMFMLLLFGGTERWFSLQTGQLNEYTERKEMPSEAVCMALANVPVGEQRSRFLAVGLADNTVRIISLDPLVSFSSLFLIADCGVAVF